MKQQAAQVAPLQEQLTQAQQDAAQVGGNAESKTRTLAKLRAEVVDLRKKTNELARAQQQIESLKQEVAAAAEQNRILSATPAQPQATATRAQAENPMNACINNLRLIDSAKQQWALEQRKTGADTPTWDDLRPYIGRGPQGELPACPSGGTYTIGTVAEKPICSVAGHVLP